MRYTVTWAPSAQAELARIWTSAPDQKAVADAANEIDRRLRISPETAGDELGDNRYLVVEPLVIVFTIDPGDRKVEVLRVGRW